ncbi:TPA: hypothetical protein R4S87_001247 [Kluyvera cryocrescens]|nr:hypothetical protein [Kluyvera cryocrescens]
MKPHIFYFPFSSGVNKYSERIRAILGTIADVSPLSLKEECSNFLKFKKRMKGIAVINWVENMLISNHDGSFSITGLLKLFFAILVLKVRFEKVIYIQHNLYPHDAKDSDIIKIKWAINILTKVVDVTAAHSPHLKNKIYVPHPLYHSPMITQVGYRHFVSEDAPYLIFGRIERYKKIESVIALFPENKRLVIAGSCSDQEYLKYLTELIKNKPNIQLIARFLTDEEVDKIIASCSALIISHADPDMIVSGSFFYSITKQLPILAVSSPFLSWVESQLSDNVIKIFNNIDEMAKYLCESSYADESIRKFDQDDINKINDMFGDKAVTSAFKLILASIID